MKKRIVFFLVFLIVALTISAQTKVFIPDTNFRNFLNDNYPSLMDSTGDSLITAQAALVGGYFVCYYYGIQDLTGIEYFKNIEGLICMGNQLTTIPSLDSLADLRLLYCSNNPLTSLPSLSGNSALQQIQCYNTLLTALPDLSANTSLMSLVCFNSQLTNLPDLSANTALVELNCGQNQLTTLPSLTTNTALQKLYFQFNQVLILPDLSANTALEYLDCRNNQVAFLPDLSSNTALQVLDCGNNQLTALPGLGSNTLLRQFFCNDNQLIALPNLSGNVALEWLNCSGNQLTSLPDLSANTLLYNLDCENNQLTTLPDFSADTSLKYLDCRDNQLTALPDFSSNVNLQWLNCSNNKLDFSDARELRIADSIFKSVYFAPQKPFGQASTYNLLPGDTLTLSIASQDSALFYQWFRGTNVVAGGPTDSILIIPNITSADMGVYTCRTYGDALKSPPMSIGPGVNGFVSEPFTVTLPVSFQENIVAFSLRIYPNPSNSRITIEINSQLQGQAELKVINLLGEEVYIKPIPTIHNSYQHQLDVSNYETGIYFLTLTTTNGLLTQKIVIH